MCERLIKSARDYMCQLVVTFVSKSLEGASKVDTIKDNPRTGMVSLVLHHPGAFTIEYIILISRYNNTDNAATEKPFPNCIVHTSCIFP